ncbi:hypothetical protein F5B20DRAFT_536232 [Whalleya microplaca]|nr:hypothetical protein F5B20DRAFT_536232 [Whalleya microplaca]
MSIIVMTNGVWQQNASVLMDHLATPHGPEASNIQETLKLVSSYDSVTFDFSDLIAEQLVAHTTSLSSGPKPGALDISCYNLKDGNITEDVHTVSLPSTRQNPHPGIDIVHLHDWCMGKATESYILGQRCFRFEQGRYAGPLPFPGLGIVGKAVGDS